MIARKTTERYDVWQTFSDGTREKVRESVLAEEAVKAAHHYCHCVGARIGSTTEVMIVDEMDCCNFHWTYERGVVFPEGVES